MQANSRFIYATSISYIATHFIQSIVATVFYFVNSQDEVIIYILEGIMLPSRFDMASMNAR